MSGSRGPLVILAVVLAAFVFGYKQDRMVSELRDGWSRWRAGGDKATTTAPSSPASVPGPVSQPAASGVLAPPAPLPAPAPTGAAQPNLGQSLDSVTPGGIEPKQEERRNLYFEKLSEQLRELRGENPPPPPAEPPPAAPPLPEETITDEQDTELQVPEVDEGSAEEEESPAEEPDLPDE